MQLQYGPIGVYFHEEKDAEGMYVSITDDEAREKYNKSAGELKSANEVAGPKLILSEYYTNVFHMEDRALERLNDLENFWFNYVDDFTYYPVDCVFTADELDDLDLYRPDFEAHVREQEALWLRDGGPDDAAWECDFCRPRSVPDLTFCKETGSLLDRSAGDDARGNLSGILCRKRV